MHIGNASKALSNGPPRSPTPALTFDDSATDLVVEIVLLDVIGGPVFADRCPRVGR